jgi:hypothetical protein
LGAQRFAASYIISQNNWEKGRTHSQFDRMQSEISCGGKNETGDDIAESYVEFFGKTVSIFEATEDAIDRHLFRVVDLAERLDCEANRVMNLFLSLVTD